MPTFAEFAIIYTMTKKTDTDSLFDAFKKSAFLKEFGEFINRGNVVELTIGVAVGGAFTTIIKSLVDDIIMPISSLLAGGLDFSTLAIDVPNAFGADSTAHIAYGNFLQNVVNFLIIAFVVFVIVKFLNGLNRKAEAKAAAEEKATATAKSKEDKTKTSKKSA